MTCTRARTHKRYCFRRHLIVEVVIIVTQLGGYPEGVKEPRVGTGNRDAARRSIVADTSDDDHGDAIIRIAIN
jgi:hypothetical protein